MLEEMPSSGLKNKSIELLGYPLIENDPVCDYINFFQALSDYVDNAPLSFYILVQNSYGGKKFYCSGLVITKLIMNFLRLLFGQGCHILRIR